MWISVKKTIFKYLFEISIEQNFRHLATVNACRANRLVVRNLDSIDILQREGTLCSATPNYARHMDTLASCEILAEYFSIFAFRQIINFLMNCGFQFRNERG